MSIDYGRRRIGVATGNSDGTSLRGLPTIDRKKKPDTIGALCTLIDNEHPEQLVIGLPLDNDDADTVMSIEARSFARKLGERTGLPVRFIDESRTSLQAEQLLRFRRKKERRDKGAVDRLAACLILEQYIRESGYM